ncbi:hypothetical protein RFI_36878, partial [Reticulomyxa filosa]
KLKDILGDMKTQSPEEFEIERIFLGLCGIEVKEVAGNDTEAKEEEQKETFEIYGSVDDAILPSVSKKLYLIDQTLTMMVENKSNSDANQINDIFANAFKHMLQTVQVDLPMFADEQKRGRIYKHASGFYDDQFIIFTLQQFISEVQDKVLASKPTLNSDHLEKF